MDPQEYYVFANGSTMAREPYRPYTWVLRDNNGKAIDRDQYRNDIISRHDLIVVEHINNPFEDLEKDAE